VRASSLAGFHGDPADRLIVATALEAGSALVTRDGAIRRSKLVETVW
jgi:PIN domain nuclease of toxin-antitoxin system